MNFLTPPLPPPHTWVPLGGFKTWLAHSRHYVSIQTQVPKNFMCSIWTGGPERVVSTGEKGGEKGSRRLAHPIWSGCYRLYNAVGGAGGRSAGAEGEMKCGLHQATTPPVPFLGLCRAEALDQ